MLISMLVAAVGVNRALLQSILGGWVFALAFHREAFASLDVSCTAATTLPPSRRCQVNGALLDELVLVTGLAPLLSITREAWLALYGLAEEEGEHVRLDWKGEEPPSSMHDGRPAAAPLALQLNCAMLFSYRFFECKHINLLELLRVS